MAEIDPHIHVERRALRGGPDFRNVMSSVVGRVPDAPSVVATGCGLDVPYAMTSSRPESVTCLACREHACVEYSAFAEQLERLGSWPGMSVTDGQVADAVERLRELAKRFSGRTG
ncbi:hypothetical protein ABH935_002627 [Catenulispora sp. GAS73]|uniref:hypothetical protein n=1 Tax=Catenulispora sp. GAS73 TaxID=3156269 RepID=UPI0035175AA0